ncbi:MAG: TraM recognition domain-containing protein [Proteobacteria bacterium]|nr:TraM recognition domain-containing protein [Pseudomonadota bacterium]
MNDLKTAGMAGETGFIVGKFDGKFIRFNKPGHIITFAPTRSGKGVGHVIPNLLTHPGSVVVNDIKGENYAVSQRERRKFNKVFTFAPFHDFSSHYNPIDFIRLGTPDELDDVALIADMLIPEEGGSDPFWDREAKNLYTGLILHVATSRPPVLRNLGEVRYLIMQSKDDFNFTIKEMTKSKNEHVRKFGAALSATEAKVMASILSTARSKTAVWDSPRLQGITSRSDFQLADIKKEPTSLYIIIPPEYLDVYQPLIRLMVGLSLAAMTKTKGKPASPVLFLVDEFPALGYMKPIEMGLGYLAGYGVTIWTFIQDLSQLKNTYKDKWESFLANCSVRCAFGTNDVDTAKVLSDMLGQATIRVKSTGLSDSGSSANFSETSRALMTPDEIMTMPFDSQLIFVQGMRPVIAEKIMYFKDPAFVGKFDEWKD